jgi:hypothetical protein
MRLKWIAVLALSVVLATPLGMSGVAYAASIQELTEQYAKEQGEQAAAREKAEHEAAAKAKEAEEQKAREQKAHEEQELKEQRERVERQTHEEASRYEEALKQQANEAPQREATAKECVVPSLVGDSVGVARKALSKAHCRLGKVKTTGRHGGISSFWHRASSVGASGRAVRRWV